VTAHQAGWLIAYLITYVVQAIVDLVHKRDVTRELMASGTSRLSDYGWTSRMRCYLEPWEAQPQDQKERSTPNAVRPVMRMAEAAFHHGLEYHGVGERLVQASGVHLMPQFT
jgi:hypothetical protein